MSKKVILLLLCIVSVGLPSTLADLWQPSVLNVFEYSNHQFISINLTDGQVINQTTFPDVVYITSILEYSGDDFLLLGYNISATWVCNVMLYHFNSKNMILSTKSKGPTCLKGYSSDTSASLGYDAMNNIAFQVGSSFPPPELPTLMQYNFDTNQSSTTSFTPAGAGYGNYDADSQTYFMVNQGTHEEESEIAVISYHIPSNTTKEFHFDMPFLSNGTYSISYGTYYNSKFYMQFIPDSIDISTLIYQIDMITNETQLLFAVPHDPGSTDLNSIYVDIPHNSLVFVGQRLYTGPQLDIYVTDLTTLEYTNRQVEFYMELNVEIFTVE
ncbi:hypothetical protein SAMD00019534_006510 [Acytostelium subglobosum LB1]|uniref:hypothetical protein n=1 Tax=Acytostelium subglobosum LB1 TaxID=1410327 RepID=UPI0006448CA6|nr:hypothetical protein SAMD00019534_006510 [Acytostelium subglobosum LB1]GAM17476.1 hypothetical protein SAMD00019534_006510 [Acytostelium subglobosum LB1]|eukprot:XP_012759538.1 hypothetical protein SAMD00019534_006510 [Acytostelium subglobosum LB1]